MCSQLFLPSGGGQYRGSWLTHPHKKGPVMKNYTRHLTSFSMVIYQAEHILWCPENAGWENLAKLIKFQVKYGKNGQKTAKNE